jgi:hypothetical protein
VGERVPGQAVVIPDVDVVGAGRPRSARVDDEAGTPRIVWLNQCDYSADDLVSDGGVERSAREDARQFLRTELAAGPVAGIDVLGRARAAGIAEQTLRRGKRDLEVKSVKEKAAGGRWVWILSPGEGGQSKK